MAEILTEPCEKICGPCLPDDAVCESDCGQMGDPDPVPLIVLNTPVRFGDLLRAAAPITQKELTKQLRLFEQRGLVSRTVYPKSRRAWSIR
jgi:hypothetical protein